EDDIEIVTLELILADLQQLERAVEKLSRQVKGDKKWIPVLELAQQMSSFLSGGSSLNTFEGRDSEAFQVLNKEMRFLTAKTVIFAANVDENRLNQDDPCTVSVSRAAVERGGYFVKVGAFFEEELMDMPEVERQEFLALAGIRESALVQVVRTSYQALGLISFFTMNEREVRAWTIPRGWVARQAAGVIHTDFERGFIRAEVIPFEVFDRYESLSRAREAGVIQIEGRDYPVRDGDILYIRSSI
ncbi:MAG TPA: DUF933 domain-containing protein, partial [Anaerolineales bacterium]|nr:DUF933 domain-containing protein [Anaerolineales bacterium]